MAGEQVKNCSLSRAEALVLTSKYLGGQWTKCSTKDIDVKEFGSGYSNRLYYVECTLASDENNNEAPSRVLIRKYGGKIVEENDTYKTMSLAAEVLVCVKFGEMGLGPKILGIFDGGRLEAFIPSHTIEDKDFMDKNTRMTIARKLARMHALNVPISKESFDQIWHLEKKIKDFEPESLLKRENMKGCDANLDFVANYDFAGEIKWLRKVVKKVKSRTVFVINDMNRLNCLVRDEPDVFGEQVTLIDYEFGAYAPRGIDIGAHFAWRTLDMKSANFMSSIEYPCEELRREFIEEYLKVAKKENLLVLDDVTDSVDNLMKEADFFSIMFSLLQAAWILGPTKNDLILSSPIGPKLVRMAEHDLTLYERNKKIFIKKYSM